MRKPARRGQAGRKAARHKAARHKAASHRPARHKAASHKAARHRPASHRPARHKPARHKPASRTARAGAGSTRREELPVEGLRSIFDSIADGVVVADAQGRLVLFNPAAERMLGRGRTDTAPLEWSRVYSCFREDQLTPFPPEELPLARALRGETASEAELFVRRPGSADGAWLSLNATPVRGKGGVVTGGVVVFRDVTSRRLEQRRIELLSSAVEQTADGVLLTDARGTIEYVNPAFERITGYPREELLGKTPALLRSGEHPPEFYEGLWRTLLGGRAFGGTISDRRRNGELFLAQQTITPILGASGTIEHLVSVVKDVTAEKRAEQRESALLVARRVQQRFYPEAPPRLPGLDIDGKAFVADVTGGDYFDYIPLAGDHLAIVIGDVSGHGLDSALVMAELRAILRSTARSLTDPGEILSVVNGILFADTEDDRFATLLLASLHVPTRQLRYASAGHLPGFLLDAAGRVRAELPATSPPLGLFADASFPARDGIALGPGDSLLLFTDGVTESESPQGTAFGFERLLETVRSRRAAGSSAIVQAIQDAVRAFTANAPPQDDLTVVVCSAGERS